ncbi:hypothetical protein N7509_012675 [Penicillium cosmopolitanum]|uniref:BAG domain-containing protein n=1 Tax=Penicillium cosmopolitanum TaxID=1131564 RepID=A0A9W9VHG1_9EURO|nr:uncharacterized protein N7509_012675 [Penicillium cosmopolitanum]KAJ5379556.1 hypothetical protein N7509_012675 [Penicillium cosmopolitanum]
MPQEAIDKYIRGLEKRPAEERSEDHRSVPPGKLTNANYATAYGRFPGPETKRESKRPVGFNAISDVKAVDGSQTRKSTRGRAYFPDWGDDWPDETSSEREVEESYGHRNWLMEPPPPRDKGSLSSTRAVKAVRDVDSTSMPPSAPDLNFAASYAKVRALSSYFESTLLPLCNNYIANVPANHKDRKLEHKKLSETMLTQVLLRADGIEVNDEATRVARRKLARSLHFKT